MQHIKWRAGTRIVFFSGHLHVPHSDKSISTFSFGRIRRVSKDIATSLFRDMIAIETY